MLLLQFQFQQILSYTRWPLSLSLGFVSRIHSLIRDILPLVYLLFSQKDKKITTSTTGDNSEMKCDAMWPTAITKCQSISISALSKRMSQQNLTLELDGWEREIEKRKKAHMYFSASLCHKYMKMYSDQTKWTWYKNALKK